MGIEIERKYLVKEAEWRSHKASLPSQSLRGEKYCQGYIPTNNRTTVRLRIAGDRGYITLKGKTTGHTRSEFEYPIPVQDAQEMLTTLCDKPLIEKLRYKVLFGNLVWEVDEFLGDNQGLIIAEVELTSEAQQIDLPYWIEREVNDKKYYNFYLTKHPYSQWKDK
ncbi:CYTH domain-containing protein [Pleurocapsales cyanobacterium LEGE 10410]|nr:CYTH domain-containing protein [Pleurocapsales cyanobacterium LEGE 10410]